MPSKKINQERDARWVTQYLGGKSIRSVADDSDVSDGAVYQVLKRERIALREPVVLETRPQRDARWAAAYKLGDSLAKIARRDNMSVGSVVNALSLIGVERRAVGRPGLTGAEYRSGKVWYAIKSNYGLTRERFDEMLIEQCGRCALCGNPFLPGGHIVHVDHDHVSDTVRGLLHPECNKGLAYIEDSVFKAQAEAYLESYGA